MRYIVGGFLSLAAAFATMYFVPKPCTSLIGSLAVFVALLLLMVAFPLLIMIGMDIEMRVFNKNLCHECQNEKIFSRQLPFCQKCLDKSLTKTMDLQVEAEKRILLAQENSWPSQEEAARNWFQQSLPQPQKWFLQKGIILALREYFPGVKEFNPNGFQECPVDSTDPALSIPSEKLDLICKFNQALKGGEKNDARHDCFGPEAIPAAVGIAGLLRAGESEKSSANIRD